MTRTRTVRAKRIEHLKVSDYSFVEYDYEIIEEHVPVEESKEIGKVLRAEVNAHLAVARKGIQKAFENGEFEL